MPVSRRSFCGAVVKGGGTVMIGGGLLVGCGNSVEVPAIVNAGLDDFPTSQTYGQIKVPLASVPALQAVGGAVSLQLQPLVKRDRPFKLPDQGVLLIHRGQAGDQDEFVAVTAICPHAGCPLGWSQDDQLVECPCHGSRFRALADPNTAASCADPANPGSGNFAGQVVHLPAMSPLTVWRCTVDAKRQHVSVDLNAVVECGDFPPVIGNQVMVPIGLYPALGSPGGSVVGHPKGLADTLIIIRVDQTTVVALSAVCTHQACTVGYVAAKKDLECPCHQSAYDLTGKVTNPPAPAPLKKYAATLSGQVITITVG